MHILMLQENSGSAFYLIQSEKGRRKVPISDILYLEMNRHCVQLHTRQEILKFWGVLEQEAEKLKPIGFSRIHRSYVINLHQISTKSFFTVTLNHGIILPIGRKYRKDFFTAYQTMLHFSV